MTTLITGANRGIGLEFVKQLLTQDEQVIACCRNPESSPELSQLALDHSQNLELVALDVSQFSQLDNLADYLEGRHVDLLINNAGLYGPKGVALGKVTDAQFNEVMNVNVLAPILLVQALSQNLHDGSKIAILSSKMGAIADNQSGGAYVYRASKSAVNAVGVSLARDLKAKGISVVLLHPGWVQTDMGGPNALINTETSVEGMLKVIDQLQLENSGEFRNYDGQSIPW